MAGRVEAGYILLSSPLDCCINQVVRNVTPGQEEGRERGGRRDTKSSWSVSAKAANRDGVLRIMRELLQAELEAGARSEGSTPFTQKWQAKTNLDCFFCGENMI